jgi:hypothetical protein
MSRLKTLLMLIIIIVFPFINVAAIQNTNNTMLLFVAYRYSFLLAEQWEDLTLTK